MSDYKDQNSEAKELKNLLLKYVHKWHYFLLAWILCVGGMFFYLWYETPLYNISGKVLVEDKKMSPAGAGNILDDLDIFKSNKIIENEIEIINSRTLISKAINNLEFQSLYKKVENFKTIEIYKKSPFVAVYDSLTDSASFITYYIDIINESDFLLSRECDEFDLTLSEREEQQFKFGEIIHTRFGDFTVAKRDGFDFSVFSPTNKDTERNFCINFRTEGQNISFYQKELKISLASKSATVLILSIEYPLPEKGKDFINSLMDEYIQGGIEEKNKVASNTLEFIKGRLQLITSDLKVIESEIEKFKSDKGIADLSEEAKLFLQTIKSYDEQLSTAEIQLKSIEYIEQQLKNENLITNEASLSVAGLNDPVLVGMLSELTRLESEKQRLKITTKEDNPAVKILDKQIATLKVSIRGNISTLKSNLTISLNTLKKIVSGLESQIKEIPKTERELIDIQRQQNIKEKLYLYLLQKQEETSIALASTVSDNKIIDRANATDKPVSPLKRNVAIIAFILGLIIPAGLISVFDYINDKVLTREQIEEATDVTILGTISQSDANDIVAISAQARSAISEEFRAIRTNLQYFGIKDNKKVILITSSMSGEGKTFISLNLGMTLAISGKKTVILEMDLRKPKLSSNLGLMNKIGISTFLVGNATEMECIKNSGLNPMLDIVSSGPIPPNPAELLLLDKLDNLIDYLKTKYDYVIIDSPPVGLVSDSLVISRLSDIAIYIIRQGYTREVNLHTIKELSESKQLSNLSIIFNDVNKNYGYGYGYGYGYYEESESNKKGFLNKLFWGRS